MWKATAEWTSGGVTKTETWTAGAGATYTEFLERWVSALESRLKEDEPDPDSTVTIVMETVS